MKVDVREAVTAESLKGNARAFWTWWTDELVALLPANWRNWLLTTVASAQVRMHGGHWVIADHKGAAAAPVGADHDGVGRWSASSDSGRRSYFERPVCVELPSQDVLRRTLRLPKAASSRLRTAIGLQIERLSPFRTEDVFYDCKVTDEDGEPGEIAVEVAIVQRAKLLEYETWFAARRFCVTAFAAESGHRFAPVHWRWRRDPRAIAAITLAAGILVWAVVFLAAPSLRESEMVREEARVSAIRLSAEDAVRAKDQLDDLEGPLTFLREKEQLPQALDVLEALTVTFPKSTRLTDLDISGGRVKAGGVCVDASVLISQLKRSSRIAAVASNTPILSTVRGLDRFNLDLTMR